MNRSLISAAWASLLVGSVCVAQVKLSVPKNRFSVEEQIEATVTNASPTPVSYCVEYGQTSPHAGTQEPTPMPFFVERRQHGSWHVLLNGPDVGSSRHAEILDSGASLAFPFRLNNWEKRGCRFTTGWASGRMFATSRRKDAKRQNPAPL